MAITLKDYAGGKRHFILQEPQGKWIVAKGEPPEPTWGYATLVRQWCGLAAPVFVAVFTDRKTILLRVGDILVDLRDSKMVFTDRWSGFLTRRFVVSDDGKELASVTYGNLVVDRDPFDSDSIFDYLGPFADKSRLERTVFIWAAAGEGRKLDAPEFLSEVEARFGGNAYERQRVDTRGAACLASYWLLFIILPAALVLWLVPTGERLSFALPIGLVLILVGENGFRGWKQLWRVK
jgi:hypothetical protein